MGSVDMAKTHEIMARYKPIAPKPQFPAVMDAASSETPPSCQLRHAAAVSLSSCLHARLPYKTRKRSRLGFAPLAATKRPLKNFSPITRHSQNPQQLPISDHCSFPIHQHQAPRVELSLLPTSPLISPPSPPKIPDDRHRLEEKVTVPVERNLLQELQKPKVISPQPMRPVTSTVSIGCIKDIESVLPSSHSATSQFTMKSAKDIDAAVEAEAMPTVVTDSRNKVRLVNSAYKEMVGQPKCLWLDSMIGECSGVAAQLGIGPAGRRINGGVVLEFADQGNLPEAMMKYLTGFTCRVKIEWITNGKNTVVDAPCEVRRLCCESADYLFAWKFYSSRATVSSCNS